MEILCSLEEVDEYYGLIDGHSDKKKLGKYDRSTYHNKDHGTRWGILATIILDQQSGITREELLKKCLSILNTPLTKRSRKLPYGKLELVHYVILEDKISARMLTTDRNNKNFWGRGPTKGVQRKLTKRGRPKKRR